MRACVCACVSYHFPSLTAGLGSSCCRPRCEVKLHVSLLLFSAGHNVSHLLTGERRIHIQNSSQTSKSTINYFRNPGITFPLTVNSNLRENDDYFYNIKLLLTAGLWFSFQPCSDSNTTISHYSILLIYILFYYIFYRLLFKLYCTYCYHSCILQTF